MSCVNKCLSLIFQTFLTTFYNTGNEDYFFIATPLQKLKKNPKQHQQKTDLNTDWVELSYV